MFRLLFLKGRCGFIRLPLFQRSAGLIGLLLLQCRSIGYCFGSGSLDGGGLDLLCAAASAATLALLAASALAFAALAATCGLMVVAELAEGGAGFPDLAALHAAAVGK